MHTSHAVREIFRLLYAYGDFILFPLVVIEGPIVTIIAGFLASLGFFSLVPTYFTIVAADLTGDILYYSAGRWWFRSAFKRVLSLFNISTDTITKLESDLKKHKGKVLFFGKLSHVFGVAILFAAGHAEIPFWDYIWFNFLATLPKSLIFLMVGYLLGTTVSNYNKFVNLTILATLVFTLLLIGLYFFISRISRKFIKKSLRE